MAKRFTDNEKWKKRFFRDLPMEYKLLWIYILDDCNHAGIWDVDLEVAGIRIGYKHFNQAPLEEVFADQIVVFQNGYKWFIPDFICFQYGKLSETSRVHQSVIQLLKKYNLYESAVECDYIEEETPTKAKRKNFSVPKLEEVKDYCLERKNNVDAESFINHYESKGWMIGKNKMKCWKSAVRTWEKNSYENGYDKRVKVKANKITTNLQTWANVKNRIQ